MTVLDADSYFPPTPPLADSSKFSLPLAEPSQQLKDMAIPPNANAAPAGANGVATNTSTKANGTSAATKVTLSLGHLPGKKDIKAVYPRTPSRVRATDHALLVLPSHLSSCLRLTPTTLPGPPTEAITNTLSLMPLWVCAFQPFSAKQLMIQFVH